MLKKTDISPINMLYEDGVDAWKFTDAWKMGRLGKFTSSQIYKLMGPKGLGEGAISYIRRKVGEEITGESSEPEVDTDATRWGHLYENDCLKLVQKERKAEFMVTRQLITVPGSREGSTPDGIIIMRESKDGLEYQAEPVECKAPFTFDNFIGLSLCKIPYEVKEEKNEYFWQCLHQILRCGALRGWFSVYNPKFKAGNFNLVEFRAMDLKKELDFMKGRIHAATELFNEIREKLLAKGVF